METIPIHTNTRTHTNVPNQSTQTHRTPGAYTSFTLFLDFFFIVLITIFQSTHEMCILLHMLIVSVSRTQRNSQQRQLQDETSQVEEMETKRMFIGCQRNRQDIRFGSVRSCVEMKSTKKLLCYCGLGLPELTQFNDT